MKLAENWKELLNYKSDTHYILLRNSDDEFYLNDMSKLEHLYSHFPYCKEYKINRDAEFDSAIIIAMNGNSHYLPTHFIHWNNNRMWLDLCKFELDKKD